MKQIKKSFALILITIFCSPLFADGHDINIDLDASNRDINIEQKGNSHLTAKVSTMGLGLEYNHPINSLLSIGFGVNKYDYDLGGTSGDVDSNADLAFESFSVIANYHPWENGFRLRAGAYYNNNEINFSADGSGEFTLANRTYQGNVFANGQVDFDKFSPYVGVGYGSEPIGDNRLSLDFDIGVMQSSPSLTLSGDCTTNLSGGCGTFDADLERERKKLQDDLDDIKIYPVISFGLTYRF